MAQAALAWLESLGWTVKHGSGVLGNKVAVFQLSPVCGDEAVSCGLETGCEGFREGGAGVMESSCRITLR